MELQSGTNNGETQTSNLEYIDDSTCSTPYVSAPSSPGRRGGGEPPISGFFYSAPTSPLHFAITAAASSSSSFQNPFSSTSSSEFEFSARFGFTGFGAPGSMSSADELFLNGQIRPMKLSTHLERPQLLDLEEEEGEEETEVRGRDLRLRAKSVRRRTRSLSPLRNTHLQWTENEKTSKIEVEEEEEEEENVDDEVGLEKTHSALASSSRCSSAGRSSKRWVFLKDFLRSKSEGRSNNKFWSTISFSPTKEKKAVSQNQGNGSSSMQKSKGSSQAFSKKLTGKPSNGVAGKRRVPPASAHELHYKANRAQAEELRKKTFLPYRQGLLGCLGFTSKSYGAMNGFARALNPVSSR
ncbi:uncharacterized protein LOC130730914 [Lotus japonicus]|uniref:uncharacterized protein LOC130730914 n=1 Tax=Lotus japonicus TaxID=34305 RepID=UPI002588813B|nr:uncharacterized protein LOC130730914 [Lotus japonicus]